MNLKVKEKKIAVIFVDIRGFTTLSEKREPEEIVSILNEYFKITTSAIISNGGMIDKFVGDCTMGLFNAIIEADDYAYNAVCAGLEMIENAHNLDCFLPEDLKGEVAFGVGVHMGEAIMDILSLLKANQ